VPQVLHISCHAELRQDSPLASVFHLDGGDWELADLRESGLLAGTSLVVAAACETGRTVSRVRDEMIGLATGLIECGARLVIASLWPVDDRATFLLVTELYRQLGQLDPEWVDPAAHAPAALRAATQWLRSARLDEIRTRARISEGSSTAAVTALRNWPGPDEFRAFTHPYYWAGFVALDASNRSERSPE
jgi:CHAT domain-containing protein